MGVIISKFQKKPTTRDILDKIEQEIQNIEDHKWSTMRKEKNYASLLFFISLSLLVIFIAIFIYYLPQAHGWREKIFLTVPICALSFFVWLLKKTLQWYCRWSLDTKDSRLRELRKEKRRILDQVMETEKYKVARELLEKYDPKMLRQQEKPEQQQQQASYNDRVNSRLNAIGASTRRESQAARNVMPPINTSFSNTSFHLHDAITEKNDSINEFVGGFAHQPSSNLRKRQSIATSVHHPSVKPPLVKNQSQTLNDSSMLNHTVPANLSFGRNVQTMAQAPTQQTIPAPQRNMNNSIVATSSVQGRPVRPVLSKERSLFEKVVDWVVADGPTNRFALICRYCYGHNGMALQEEFETLNFRCCYCYNLNTTQRQRQVQDQLQKHEQEVVATTRERSRDRDDSQRLSKSMEVLEEKQDLENSEKGSIEQEEESKNDAENDAERLSKKKQGSTEEEANTNDTQPGEEAQVQTVEGNPSDKDEENDDRGFDTSNTDNKDNDN